MDFKKFGVRIKFLQMLCSNCGNEWGIYLGNKSFEEIPLRKFLCQSCTIKILDEKEILENEGTRHKDI
jgi:hypothetical protein